MAERTGGVGPARLRLIAVSSFRVSMQSAANPTLRHRPSVHAWLRLLRWPNLGIIFFTQAVVWWCVIHPIGDGLAVLHPVHFLLLTSSTVAIAAAGYIINDYFDIRIDAINRPRKVVLEHAIHRRIAIIVHSMLNAAGLLAAVVVACAAGSYWLLALQVGCTMLLWVYSTHLKQRFAVGNIAVALLTALTIVTLGVYEPALRAYAEQAPLQGAAGGGEPAINPLYILAGYAYFAFVLTWMREVVKDMEDLPGDSAEGCDTMPIRWGLLRSSRFVQGLTAAAVIPLAYGGVRAVAGGHFVLLGLYLILLIVVPLVVWAWRLTRRATTKHYAAASRWLKILMVVGIGFLLLYRYRYA